MFFLADGEETFTGGVVVGLDALAGVPEVGCLATGATYLIKVSATETSRGSSTKPSAQTSGGASGGVSVGAGGCSGVSSRERVGIVVVEVLGNILVVAVVTW